MKIAFFCTCGAGAEGEIRPEAAGEKFKRFWYETHKGPDHSDCTRKEAQHALLQKEESKFKTDG